MMKNIYHLPLKFIGASLTGVVCQKFLVVTNWMSAQEIFDSDSAPGRQGMVDTECCQIHELLHFLVMLVTEPCRDLKYHIFMVIWGTSDWMYILRFFSTYLMYIIFKFLF